MSLPSLYSNVRLSQLPLPGNGSATINIQGSEFQETGKTEFCKKKNFREISIKSSEIRESNFLPGLFSLFSHRVGEEKYLRYEESV